MEVFEFTEATRWMIGLETGHKRSMKIAKHQLASLEANSRKEFHRDLLSRLNDSLCDEIKKLDQQQALDLMAQWHDRGLIYGIEKERTMGRFLGIHLLLHPNFDILDPASTYLNRTDISGENKIEAVWFRMKNDRKEV